MGNLAPSKRSAILRVDNPRSESDAANVLFVYRIAIALPQSQPSIKV
mgnify:CR=1 FL=1